MMTQELFKFLPSEVIMSILSKLPVRTISICKCVCKSWLHLVETRVFVELHLSTSLPGLVTFQVDHSPSLVKFFEIEDGGDVERHDLHYNLVTEFRFPRAKLMYGSVDGLLWMFSWSTDVDVTYICNPITRDYIGILSPPEFPCTTYNCATCGFGSCKITGQHKVVRVLLVRIYDKEASNYRVKSVAECHVYTLGTGSGWRRLAPCALHCAPPKYSHPGAFVNGNLHWLGCDLEGCLWVSCFDLETECFSNFSAPPLAQRNYLRDGAQRIYFFELFVLGGSLCLIDKTHGSGFVIWLMEEYGVAKSWTKKLVINYRDLGECRAFVLRPIEVFKDGDILMEINYSMLFYYSSTTKTIQQVDMLKGNCPSTHLISAISHTPSFRSLKSFGMENLSATATAASPTVTTATAPLCREGQKMDWSVLEPKIKRWLHAVKVAIKTLFCGERIICDIFFSSSEMIAESCFTEISKCSALWIFSRRFSTCGRRLSRFSLTIRCRR